MRSAILFLIGAAIFLECLCAKDFSTCITNARLTRNPPLNASDLNIVFDIELKSLTKDGFFANVCSLGGCYFKDIEFLYDNGNKQKKFGGSAILPLTKVETDTFVYVSTSDSQIESSNKIATITTDLKKELSSFDSLNQVSKIKSFTGVMHALLKIFSIKSNKFEFYKLEVKFEATRLPTGNAYDLKIGDVEVKDSFSR